MDANANPLLDFSGLPRFGEIGTGHITPALDVLIGQARASIESVAHDAAPPTWESVVEPVLGTLDRLDRAWSAVRHLNAVVNTPALRDAYNADLPKVTALFSDLGQDLRLFANYRTLRDAPAFAALDAGTAEVIDNELRDFKLGGAELPDDGKARLKAVHEELAELSAKFDQHLLDATNAWSLHVEDEAELAGVPADVLADARAAAQANGKSGWMLSLRMPCYLPVMQYAHDRELRHRLHEAYATRASNSAPIPIGTTRR